MPATATARAELETLLRARKLDRTVTRAEVSTQGSVPTGIAGLDEALGGGFPRGELSEIAGPRSSGRSSVLAATLAATTSKGELAALVDTLDMLDVESAAGAGIRLDRLLWIRGEAISRHADAPATGPRIVAAGGSSGGGTAWADGGFGRSGRRPPSAGRLAAADVWTRLLDRAVKALNLVLQAGGFDLVGLDLGEVPPEAIRRLPFTTWFRLQRTLEGSRTACVLVAPAPVSRSAGGVTLELSRAEGAPGRWSGQAGHVRLLLGLDIEARVVRSREAGEGECQIRLAAGG
jgi:recombination protein RecA